MQIVIKYLLFLFILSPILVSGQIDFYKIYTNNGYDFGQGIVQLEDSSYLITGSSSSFQNGASQAFLLKVDSLGNYNWSKNFGGSESEGGRRVLYKKNVGVGTRRSTLMNPGGNLYCNKSHHLYNNYRPGTGGVGASSTAQRRAKNRLATVCGAGNKCGQFYNYLGLYNNYTQNPNGFFPYPPDPNPGAEPVRTFQTSSKLYLI